MRGLSNRIATLERSAPPELSPAVRAWLGWPITDAERDSIDRGDFDPVAETDTSSWSKEMREWLGVE